MGARGKVLLTTVLMLAALLGGCAVPPKHPEALDDLDARLEAFRADTERSARVPLALAEAERAVRDARLPGLSEDDQIHRIYLARRRIEIAEAEGDLALARSRAEAVDQRRTDLLLRASRLEVEQARREAEQALLASAATLEEMQRAREDAMTAEEHRELADRQAADAREEAQQARRLAEAQSTEVELARREADLASQQANSLRRRLEYMEYRETDRGVVVTLGDVLFESGEAELQPGARGNLEDVVELLGNEPDKSIRIEGHTDSTGPAQANLALSERRAQAVRDMLVEMGIDGGRIEAVGMGEDFPIASNETPEGQARNRRVDVIVLNE